MKKWFHGQGIKMHPKYPAHLNPKKPLCMVIIANAADTVMFQVVNFGEGKVLCDWQLLHGPGQTTKGSVVLTRVQALDAFGLSDTPNPEANDFVFANAWDAEVGYPGLFVRSGQFLNVPCPGTACDGDPNISVFLSDENRAALRKFLQPA